MNYLRKIKQAKQKISDKALMGIAMAHTGLLSTAASGQDFNIPNVNVPGVDGDADAVGMASGILRYTVLIAVWVIVVLMGVVLMTNILKAVAKVRRDEDTKWPDVVKELVGNALILVVMLMFGGYVTTQLI